MLRRTTILVLGLSSAISLFSQTGPGGVGNASSLPLWLRSSDITVGNGNEVSTWTDASGNGNDFTGRTGASIRPTWDSLAINGFPAVLFHGDGSRMQDDDGENYINGLNQLTIITLIQSDELSTIDVGIFDSQGANGSDDALTWRYDNAGANGGGNDVIKWGLGPNNTAQLESADNTHTVNPQLLIGTWQSGDIMRLYLDGQLNVPTANDPAWTGTITNADRTVLGRGPKDNDGSRGWNGYIVEFALLNFDVNATERILIENYLAAKYQLPVANDFYVFQNTHGQDVVGIGQSGADTHTESMSANMLGISTPSTLDDGDWLLMGHDGGDASTWTTSEQINGDTNLERLAREWRFDVTNTPGTVTVTINPADLPAFDADFDFYTLWIDTDGDFTSGAVQYPLVQNGGVFEATGVTITDGMFATIAAYRPEINFAQSAFSGLETVSPATFQVSIDYAVDANITVDYTVSGTHEDLPSPGTFTITAGNTSTTISQAITSGDAFESDETIILTLTAASQSAGIIGSVPVSTYTVKDDGTNASNTIRFDAPFSYGYVKEITVNQTMIPGTTDLTNFPLLIKLTGADLTEVETNGIRGDAFDIRFTLPNSVQWLEHQIERYSAGNEYLAWVKIPILDAEVNTKINMYYGNAGASTDPSVSTVFNSEYEVVYHLDDATDASQNGNNGTLFGNAAITTDGYIGNGLTLDGNNDYLLNSNDPSLVMNPTDAFSISLWFKGTGSTAELVSRMDPGQNNRGYTFRILNSGGPRLGLLLGQSYGGTPVALRATTSLSSLVVDGNWHYLVGTYDGSTNLSGMNIYIDGENTTITSDGGLFDDNLSASDNTDPNIPLSIGVRDGGDSNSNDTNGEIDEVRIVRNELNANWIKAEYNNMTDAGTYITFGASSATTGFRISESTNSINLTIALASVDANDVNVNYAVTAGTATNGADYTLASGVATVTAGNLSTSIFIDLTDDSEDEADETFTVSLSNPSSITNVSLGANNEIQIILVDDDAGPTLSVADTLISVNEGSASNLWSVNLSAASGQVVTADYTVTALSATVGSDYILSSGSLSIPINTTSVSVGFNVIDDEIIETAETFAIKLSNVANATLDVAYDSVTVTINDNDNFGIDGPGGVGDADGTGTLVMWMIADSASVSGSNVVSWENEVGISELNMTPPLTAPVKVLNARNGHAEISFADVNDVMTTVDRLSASYFPYNEATTFTVTRHDNLVQRSNTYGTSTTRGGGLAGNRFSTHMPWNGQVYFDIGNCCGTDGRSQFAYDPNWTGNYTLLSYVASATDGKTARGNATQKDYDAGTDNFLNHTNYYFNLGQTQTNNFQGDILEFIMYTSPLNDAQVIITENYLAAKYNLTLDQNDYYAFKTTHSHEVVGIGREDASNFHNAAKSSVLTISNASDLGDVEYVFVGHDNASIASWTATDVPSGLTNIQRVPREFRVDVQGTPGTISIAIDQSRLPALPTGYSDYVLMTDGDGIFNSGSTIYPMALVNDEYVANNVVITQGTYFTIGTHRRTISFVGNTFQAYENINKTISLGLSLASGSNISIPYTITGSATSGSDYTIAASGTFTIAAGKTTSIIDLGILNDAVEETDETLIITLGAAPAGTILGTNSTFTYTINDDDIIRSINFDFFKYSKEVTINGAQVTGSHADFPVMIAFTDNDLRTTGNSGYVENANGYDIAFYDSLNSVWVDHQLEYYNPATGEAVIWVRIPSLSSGVDVKLTMFYGNSGITFDQSSTATWKSSYKGVWHMGEDDFDDATSNGANGVDQGAVDVDGIIGRAASFNGLTRVEVSDISNLAFGVSDSYTISAWYKGTDASKTIAGLVDDNNNGQGYDLYISGSNYLMGWQGNDAGDKNYIRGSAGGAINNDVWNYVVVTYDGVNGIAYTNGANAMGTTDGTLTGTLSPDVSFTIGSRSAGAAIARGVIGAIDEVRVLNEALSADWIATEYNNQSNPGGFVTINPVQNANTGLTLDEDVNQVTVSVRVDPIDEGQATTFSFANAGTGTATILDDFTLTPATVTIPAGSRTGSFTFNVINDLTDETDETIVLNINTPSSNTKLGSVNQQTYTITDDDDLPTIGFVDDVSVANEGSSLVMITLTLNIASGNDVSVNYSVTGGTATSSSDFIALSGTIVIPAGSLTQTISFQPIDDAMIESPETVEITLASPVNGTLSVGNEVHTVTIADNDDLGFEGPGGVGNVENADGEKLLKLWLIADSVSFSGSNVTIWNNLIKNISVDYDMVPVGTAPNVVNNAVNGHKEISFNDVNDALVSQGSLSAVSFPGNEMSFFIVTEADNLNQDSYAYATDDSDTGAPPTNSINARIPNGSGNVVFDMDGDRYTTAYQTSWAGKHSIFTHIVSSDTFLVYRNNGLLVNRDDANPSFTGHPAYKLYLGKNGATGAFQGDIAEVIMFSREVNIAQSKIINNYLAAKYNLTISDDYYNFEVSHGVEVAGIGRYNATNQHVAARAGIVTISNASNLNDGEYVLFGHDNKSVSSWTTSEVPSAGILRTAREWRFDNTGSPGTISIAISTDLLPPLPTGNEDYIIMKDADGNFSSGATIINTVFVDGQYKASNLSIVSGDYVTFGIATRTVSFVPTSRSGSETVPASATLSLSLASSENITLDYTVTGGTATGGNVDYSLASSGQVTFIAGQTSVNIALGIINDSNLESDETIEIKLSNPPSGVFLSDSVFTYTINDDDNTRRIQFNSASSSGAESVTAVSLQVDLNQIDATNPTSVDYAITGGTAQASPSPDYTFTAGTLVIPANQTNGTINFTILDDVLSEATETIIISLTNPVNANLGANSTHTYSITDNDAAVNVQFQSASTTIDEGGSVANIFLKLSATSGQNISVDYTVAGVTATGGGVDYALANGTLVINAGQQLGTINLALTDDGIEESAETLTITLSNPVGATLGSQTAHTVTIVDNDAEFGYHGPGGVGDLESNMLWLDATAINGKGVANLTNGANVTTWVDRSGNGYDFTAIGAPPVFDVDALNLKNTVVVSSSTPGFQAPTDFSNALSNYTFFSVMSQSSGNYLAETNTTANGDFRLSQSSTGLYTINGVDYLPNASTNPDVTTWRFNSENSPNRTRVYRNGSALASDNNYRVMTIRNNFALGSRNSTQTQSATDFAGNISEFIIFKRVINDAQQVIIENYLGNKYGLTIANDLYSYEGTYGNDIVGIGRTNNQQHLQSMSDSLLMISGASNLDNDEYVFIGHDNGSDQSWTVTEAPDNGSNVRRIAREWRTDLTGSPGTIIIKIDTTMLPTPPVGFDQYVIYTDTDGDFRSGSTAYQLEYSEISGLHVTDEVTITDGMFITIGIGKPVVQFTLASSSGDENLTNPSIQVDLNFTLGEAATVNYAATGGTAIGGNVDYLLASGTLTIAAGQTSANISLGVIDDATQESDETIEITLTTPSSNVALGSRTVHTYTIHDDDNPEGRTVAFASAGPGSGDEASSSTTSVTVSLNTPDNDVVTTVDLVVISTAGNAATISDDFILSTTTVSFSADGSTVSQTFDITIVDDFIYEGTELVTIQLINPVNADLGVITQYTLDIADDDAQPTVDFADATSFVSEGAAIASIEVMLSAVSVTDVTVNYTVASTATSGSDFTLSDGSILIPAGSISKSIQAIIVDDLVTEAAETITITLSGATNATVSGTTSHVLTILDNDQSGSTGPGGVGDATNNLLWLRGDNFVSGTWSDKSGNGNNYTGAGPIVGVTEINSQPTVAFDGTQSMTLGSALSTNVSDYEIYFVSFTDVTTDQVIFNANGGILLGIENANGAFQDTDASWKGDEIALGSATPTIVRWSLESGSGLSFVSLNGSEVTPAIAFDYSASSVGNPSTLGSLTGGGSGFDGEMAELLFFNSPLNNTQSIIVENYLSTRYNIGVANDFFAFDDGTANNDYFYDLVGIGQQGVGDLHVTATSEDYLTISNPDDLATGEYLMIAHNGAGATSWTLTGAPANGSTQRLSRQWRVDKTGDPGAISLQIDTTALPTPPSNGLTWALIVTSDGDFTSIDATYPLTTISGDIVGVNGLNLNDGDYFTFALIKFQTTGISSDFSNPLAWTTGVVPTAGTDVYIIDSHNLFLSEDIVIGSLSLEGTGSLDLNGFTMELSVGCIEFNGTGSVAVSASGSTIGYTNSNPVAQCVSGMTYNNLFTDGPIASSKYLLGDITVLGDMSLQSNGATAAYFDARELNTTNDYDITIKGDWTSEITFLPRTGTVTFDGNTAQVINSPAGETFNNLVINKVGSTTKADSTLSMASNISTNGTLTLTVGFIDLGAFDLEINNGSSIIGGSKDAYLITDDVGVLRHAITATSTTYTFPIGDASSYSPFSFTLNSGTLSNSKVTINLRDAKHTNIVEGTFLSRYWTLENENITGSLDYNVTFTYTTADVVGSESSLLMRKFSTSGNTLGGTVNVSLNTLTNTGFTSFSDFTGEAQAIPLPVELLYFDGLLDNGEVHLTWATASEFNNHYFEVMRSVDGKNFESLTTIEGAGTSSEQLTYEFFDVRPVTGYNYYRLDQYDFDGQSASTPIIVIENLFMGRGLSINVFPNPATNRNITLELESGNAINSIKVIILSLKGEIIFEREFDATTYLNVPLDINNEVIPGLYLMIVEQGDKIKKSKLLFK